MNNIEKRALGKTGIQVSPIGLGTLELGASNFIKNRLSPMNIPQEGRNAIVKTALDGGINWFDTYLDIEQYIVTALRAAGRSDAFLLTKWFPIFKTAADIKKDMQKHIKFLDGYSIGLYMVHNPWGFSSIETEMKEIAYLFEVGKIQSIGVGNFNAKNMRRAHEVLSQRGIPLVVNEVCYNLAYRKIETNGVLETAKELGITIIAYGPLMEGLLTGKYHKNPELIKNQAIIRKMVIKTYFEKSRPLINTLEEIAVKYNATPAQIALNWVINFHGDSVVAIPGATNVQQAESNAGAMRFRLSQDDMMRLDELSRAFR